LTFLKFSYRELKEPLIKSWTRFLWPLCPLLCWQSPQ